MVKPNHSGAPLLLKFALAASIVTASVAVSAQSESESELEDLAIEEIVVTGMRQSLGSAQDTKRFADTFVDGVNAIDIGALPDRSVLEAMQRIPGVSIERMVQGWPDLFSVEGRGAVIRGMTATRSEFNGREAFHANGRGLSFADVPPELMAGVDIYKNQTADMIEGGIGGTVSLRTRKPFDQRGQLIAINAEGIWGDDLEKWNPAMSGLYSNRWQTSAGEIGFLIHLQDSENVAKSEALHSNSYMPYSASLLAGAGDFIGDGSGTVWMPQASTAGQKEDTYDKQGWVAAFQWRDLENNYELTVEHIQQRAEFNYWNNWIRYEGGNTLSALNTRAYGDTEIEFDERGVFQSGFLAHANWGYRAGFTVGPNSAVPNTRYPNPYFPAPWYGAVGGMAQFGSRFNTQTERAMNDRKLDDTSVHFVWTPNDAWTVELDYQHISAAYAVNMMSMNTGVAALQRIDLSGSDARLDLIEPWNGERDNNPAVYDNGVVRPGWTDDPQGDANYFQDPTSYWNDAAWDIFDRDEGTSNAFRIDASYAMSDSVITGIKSGLRWNKREQTLRDATVGFGYIAPWYAGGMLYMDHEPNQNRGFYEVIDWSDFQGGGVLNIQGGNSMLGFSRDYVTRMLEDPTCPGDPDHLQYSPAGYWIPNRCREGVDSKYGMFLPSGISDTSETNQAAYVRVDFAFENLPKRVAGNIGLRYVRIERDSNGFVLSPGFDRDFAGTGRDLPGNLTAPLTGSGVLEYAQAQVDAGSYGGLDAFYAAPENLWLNEPFWYLSDSERAFATEAAGYNTASSTYDAWLPSLNVKVELTSELIGRFAVSKAIAQSTMSDVQNRITTSARVNSVRGEPADPDNAQQWETAIQSAKVAQWTGSGGNPYLEPMESIQYDAALEWYFANAGSLTGTLFYKDLSNFFVFGANSQPVTNSETGETRQVDVKSRANGEDGEMRGYELAYQQFFDQLPGFWSGFGVQANYTRVEANGVPPSVSATPTTDKSHYAWSPQINLDGVGLQGQSEHTANFVLMYEKQNWSARLAYNWRSEYLVSYRDGISGFPVMAGAAGVMDASVIYDVTDQITLSLQATNMLDSLNKTYFIMDDNNTQAPKSWFRAERQIIFGVRMSF